MGGESDYSLAAKCWMERWLPCCTALQAAGWQPPQRWMAAAAMLDATMAAMLHCTAACTAGWQLLQCSALGF